MSLSVQRRPDHLEEVVLPVQLAVDAHGEGALPDGVQGQPLEQVVDVDQRGPGVGRGVGQQPHHGVDSVPHDARHLPHLGRGEGGGQHSPATLVEKIKVMTSDIGDAPSVFLDSCPSIPCYYLLEAHLQFQITK